MANVVFSMFDQGYGPVALFSTLNDELLTKKVAVKSIVSTLTNVQGIQANQIQGEAIIPLPQEKLMSFISYATLSHKTSGGENLVIALSILVPSDNPSLLYRNATTLSQKARVLRDFLDVKFKPGSAVNEEVKFAIQEWAEIVETPTESAIDVEQTPGDVAGLSKLFNFLPVRKSRMSSSDPVAYGFYCLITKVPLLLVGDMELMLWMAEIFQKTMPVDELRVEQVEVEEVVFWQIGEVKTDAFLFKSKSDITVLNPEEYKRATFYKDPAIVLRLEEDVRVVNVKPEKESIKTITKIVKKARDLNEDGLAVRYFQGEINKLSRYLDKMFKLIQQQKPLGIKDMAKHLGVESNYVYLLAETLKFRKMLKVNKINSAPKDEIYLKPF